MFEVKLFADQTQLVQAAIAAFDRFTNALTLSHDIVMVWIETA
jgi:hypothetical protein